LIALTHDCTLDNVAFISAVCRRAILYNSHHTLHLLLPPKSEVSHNYQLRQRVHERLLPQHQGHLIDKNFI